MTTHSSILAWKISWTEEAGRLQSMGSRRVRHDWTTSLSLFTFMHWRRKWQPTPVFLPGESQGWKPSGLLSMGSHRVEHDWRDLAAAGNGTLLLFSWKNISKRFMLAVYFHCVCVCVFFPLTLNLMISSLDKILINDWIGNWVHVTSSHFGSLFSVKRCRADPCGTRLH